MANIWVLVAESSRAKIYMADSPIGSLTELEDFVHPRSRQHEQDITSDLPGSRYDGKGGHHHMDEQTTIHDHELDEFAKEIGEKLEAARTHGKYERLVLVAGPDFLGHLRKNLTNETMKLVSVEVNKNLVKHSVDEVRGHLPERL